MRIQPLFGKCIVGLHRLNRIDRGLFRLTQQGSSMTRGDSPHVRRVAPIDLISAKLVGFVECNQSLPQCLTPARTAVARVHLQGTQAEHRLKLDCSGVGTRRAGQDRKRNSFDAQSAAAILHPSRQSWVFAEHPAQ